MVRWREHNSGNYLSPITDLLPITLSLGTAAQEFRAIRSPLRVSILCSFCPFNCLVRDWITSLFRQPRQRGSSGPGRASGAALLCQDPFDSTVPSRRKVRVLGPKVLPILPGHQSSWLSRTAIPVFLLTSAPSLCPTVPTRVPRCCQVLGWHGYTQRGKWPHCLLSHVPQLPTQGEDILTQNGQGSVGLILHFLWTGLGLNLRGRW